MCQRTDRVTAAAYFVSHWLNAKQKIKVIDTNGHGFLSADEHKAGAAAMFEKWTLSRTVRLASLN